MASEGLSVRRRIAYAFDRIGDKVFTPQYNPLYWLGTICFLFLILITISGLYLFIFYRTSAPYQTIQYLTVEQWYLGGIMRSIHRYASDGFVLFMAIHMFREFLLGRYRQWRWLSWGSGIALLLVSLGIGVTGYFLVWDERAQVVAIKTAQILSDIPIFVEPPQRSFLSNAGVDLMLFFVILLGHIAISFMVIGVLAGIHVSRNARPAIKPPRVIAVAILCVLLLLSLIAPATSAPPADIERMPIKTSFDWIYLFIYPLASSIPKSAFWFTSVGGTLLLFMLPFIGRSKRMPPVQISENCVGCEQCNKDCPYEAIRMIPRRDERPYLFQAEVMANRCASCGICVGSCNSRVTDLPNKTREQIEKEMTELLNLTPGEDGRPRLIGFICENSVSELINIKAKSLKDMPDVPVIMFPCVGMLNHSMVEYALKSGADGVFVCGCQIKECYYREGSKWTRERLNGDRAPVLVLKEGVDYSRIRAYWLSPLQGKSLLNEINIFREELKDALKGRHYNLIEPVALRERRSKMAVTFSAVFALLIFTSILFFLFTKPTYSMYSKEGSLIKFTFKRPGKFATEGKELTKKDTETKLKHMQKTQSQFQEMRMEYGRERLPTYVEIELDGRNILSKTFYPTGLKRDGSTFAYEEMPAAPGTHDIKIRMRDSKEDGPFEYNFERKIDLTAGKVAIIDFDRVKNRFFILGQDEVEKEKDK
ncbi:MAG: hydrogenase iron-sulfur subunit [Nitrospirae bacterium]|nr:hydrogenase iron-sulfur subunit [Nitrospirota bacterium]